MVPFPNWLLAWCPLNLGAEVLLLDSLISEYGSNLYNIAGIEDQVRVNISDVRDPHSMKCLVQDQDYLLNLGSYKVNQTNILQIGMANEKTSNLWW
jgi:hypothetical protein